MCVVLFNLPSSSLLGKMDESKVLKEMSGFVVLSF